MNWQDYEILFAAETNNWQMRIIKMDESELGKLILLNPQKLPTAYPHKELWVIFPYENNLGSYQVYPALIEDDETGDEILSSKNFAQYQQVSRYLFNQYQLSLPDVNWMDDILRTHFEMDFYEFERWVTQMRQF